MSVDTRLIRTYYVHSAENRPEQKRQTLQSLFSKYEKMASRFAAFLCKFNLIRKKMNG